MKSENGEESFYSSGSVRLGNPVRSSLLRHSENENFTRNTSSLRSNKSFDLDHYLLSKSAATWELKNVDATSLRSLTVPVGSTDGKRIVKRSETSPEELLGLPAR